MLPSFQSIFFFSFLVLLFSNSLLPMFCFRRDCLVGHKSIQCPNLCCNQLTTPNFGLASEKLRFEKNYDFDGGKTINRSLKFLNNKITSV